MTVGAAVIAIETNPSKPMDRKVIVATTSKSVKPLLFRLPLKLSGRFLGISGLIGLCKVSIELIHVYLEQCLCQMFLRI